MNIELRTLNLLPYGDAVIKGGKIVGCNYVVLSQAALDLDQVILKQAELDENFTGNTVLDEENPAYIAVGLDRCCRYHHRIHRC